MEPAILAPLSLALPSHGEPEELADVRARAALSLLSNWGGVRTLRVIVLKSGSH
jgi:hypothetical protein